VHTRTHPSRRQPPRAGLGRFRRAALAALLAGAALTLAGCLDADTLGDAPPTVVQVGSPARWDNGVGELMQLKCGVCHQVPRGPLSPAAVPQSFDLNYHTASPAGVPGAANPTVLGDIGAGILRGPLPGRSRMPLDYATPLVPSEIAALEDWASSGGP
jgi:hypothetical protein